jgi:hypothetical protein
MEIKNEKALNHTKYQEEAGRSCGWGWGETRITTNKVKYAHNFLKLFKPKF